jgi:diguanylate cyclase (GGDEF)-like protein/PAS domain S-box-containing protein
MLSRSVSPDRVSTKPNAAPSPPPVRLLARLVASNSWPRAWRIAGGAALFLIGLALRWRLFGLSSSALPFVTYVPAVAIGAMLFGRAGGIAAATLSMLAVLAAAPTLWSADWSRLAGFGVIGLVIVSAFDFARKARARLHAAALALQNQAQLTHFVEQAPAAMAMFDRDMRYLASSRRWRDGIGRRDDLVGRSHYEIVPEIPEHWKQANARGLAGETVPAQKEVFSRADGSQRWLWREVQPWRSPQGDIGGIVIFVEDITDSVREQESTRQSEAALRALGDNLPGSVVFRFTRDRDGAPHFLYISAGVAQLNGVSAEEVLADGAVLLTQALPEHLPALREAATASLRDRADLAFDTPIRRPDGAVRWMRLRARPDPRPDGATIWNGVYTDVSEEIWLDARQREEASRQSFVLDLADALKPLSDPGDVMTVAGERLGQALACHQVVYCEIDETQTFGVIAREWTDGSMPSGVGAHRLADLGPELVAGLRAGRVNAIEDVAADPRASSGVSMETYRARKIGAFVAAPLIKDGRLVAVLSIHHREKRSWSALDLALVEETAQRTWSAVERARTARALRDSEELLRFALRAADAGAWSWTLKTNELYWSEELRRLYGLQAHHRACIETWLEMLHPDGRDDVVETIKQALASEGDLEFEWRANLPSGAERWLLSRGGPLRDPDGRVRRYIGVVIDITDRKKSEQKIGYLAHHDPLTGLPNRAAFNQRLAAAVARADEAKTSVALLCMDLDRFKEVNDVFGHAAGDELLRRVSRALLAASEGAEIARVGGDEFMAVVTGTSPAERAAELAARLREAVCEPFEIEGQRMRIGLSVGVALYPDHGDVATALANADAALYRAKAEGGGDVRLFDSALDRRLRERHALFQDLSQALKRGELSLHYQPQARIDGEVFGFEALLRWRHPSRGLVSPSEFIPIAEERGLIGAIGEWALREACREAASWPNPLSVAVNLSPVQFLKDGLAGVVHAALLETGLPAHRLELEITEGVLVDDFSRVTAILRQLKQLGARVAIDDFGAGYSSLAYLQSFPFDKIKIDRSFVSNLMDNGNSRAIIRAIVGLGRGLDVPLIAEGVETREQLAFLRSEGCGEAQGYLLGAPRPIEAYAALVGRAPASAPPGPEQVSRCA